MGASFPVGAATGGVVSVSFVGGDGSGVGATVEVAVGATVEVAAGACGWAWMGASFPVGAATGAVVGGSFVG